MPQLSESGPTDGSPPSAPSKKRHDFEDDPEDCVQGNFIKYAIRYSIVLIKLSCDSLTLCILISFSQY